MNDMNTSLRHFSALLLVIDFDEEWLLSDMIETLYRDFWSVPGVARKGIALKVSKILVDLFGDEVKGIRGQAKKRIFHLKLNIDLTGSSLIYPGKTDMTVSGNEVKNFLARFPSGTKVCFYRNKNTYIHTGLLIKTKEGEQMILEMNREPSINKKQDADTTYIEINNVSEVLLRDAGAVYIDNECLLEKSTNGVDVISALYTWARVTGKTVQYKLTDFNCDHFCTLLMVGKSMWTTKTKISVLGQWTSSYNCEGEISQILIENIVKKMA